MKTHLKEEWTCLMLGSRFKICAKVTDGSNKLGLHYTRPKRLSSDKHSSLLGAFHKLWRKRSVVNTAPAYVWFKNNCLDKKLKNERVR